MLVCEIVSGYLGWRDVDVRGSLVLDFSVWNQNNVLYGLSLGEALRIVPSCNSGLAAPSSYWPLLADVKSPVLQGAPLVLGSRGEFRPRPFKAEKHPQKFLYISKGVGPCSGEKVDFPLICILDSWTLYSDTPQIHVKTTSQLFARWVSSPHSFLCLLSPSLPSFSIFFFFILL